MLTAEDIKKLIEAESEVFVTKTEFNNAFEGLRKDFSNLQSAVDAYAKKADAYFQEMVVLSHKVNRMEKWIHTQTS